MLASRTGVLQRGTITPGPHSGFSTARRAPAPPRAVMADAPVFKLPAPGPEPMTTDLDGWVKLGGEPWMKTWIQHTSADGSVISGTWEAGGGSYPATYHASYKAYEFVHMIEGKIVITPDGGEAVTLGPGDAFVVEPGFKGVWTIEAPVKKHFAIKLK